MGEKNLLGHSKKFQIASSINVTNIAYFTDTNSFIELALKMLLGKMQNVQIPVFKNYAMKELDKYL